ncbi:MAG TPA: TonB-dependent receptor [Sphingobacteriaceae bacterium]|nr:TonB-dependent receptor [Sphingobacteriaceae bacterium]
MKRLYFLSVILFLTSSVYAQVPGGGAPSVTGRISGTIIDSITKKPVDYAAVAVGKSGSGKNTNGSLTDEKGSFKIDNIAPGAYKVTITFLGYQTKIIDPATTTPGKPDLNLGKIILSPNQKMLGEVVVEGQASIIENKIDRIVYNAEKDVAISGGNAADVLRKVPLLSVDMDGNVSLRGSQGVKVLINGKPSGAMAGSVADALKAIPADQIKNVEVITSPSAKYDAEGTSGIINIITKKNNLEGVSGSVNAGVGTRQNSGNLNLNARKGRLGVTGNGGGYYSWPALSKLTYERSNINRDTLLTQSGESRSDRLATNGSIGADYDFNNFNSVSSNIKFNWFETGVNGSNLSKTIAGANQYDFTRETDNQFGLNGFDWNSDFTHKFKKQGHEISFAYQLTKSHQNNDYTSIFSNNPVQERGSNDATNTENTLQVDYIKPFKKITLELGAKTILRDILSVAQTDGFNPATNTTSQLPGRNYDYDYGQDVLAGYTTLAFTLGKKLGVKAGVRYETTDINGESLGQTTAGLFKSNYENLVPSITLSRTFKDFSSVKLSYNQRIQRPSLFYLNPFLNSSDAFNQQQGNPSLKPEQAHNVDLNFSKFIKKTVINASVYYRRTNDIIESIVRPKLFTNPQTGLVQTVSLTSFDNIGSNNSFGFNFFGQINPIKALTFRGNMNVFSYDINTVNSLASPSDDVYLVYNGFFSTTITLPKAFVIETFLVTNSPRRTSQGKNPSFNMWNIGMKKEIYKKKGSIGLTVIDPFNERKNFRQSIQSSSFAQTSNFSVPFRSVGVNFSYRFGKLTASPAPRRKRGVTNDDLKQGEGQQGNQ